MTVHVFFRADRLWAGLSGGMCCVLTACLACSSGQLQPPTCMRWAAHSPPGRLVICLADTPALLRAASGPLLLAIN